VALGLALFLAQAWLAAHELEHLFHHDDEPCAICLIGTGGQAAAPSRPARPSAPAWLAASTPSLLEHRPLQRSGHRPQAARAPPAR